MGQPLDDFFASYNWNAVEAKTGWMVARDQRDGERIVVTVVARDGERYSIQFLCDGYPTVAPSVVFVNSEGSRADARAWPRGTPKLFEEVKLPPNSFLCVPLTREGLAHHPEWATNGVANAWNPNKHTLMTLFNHVQRLLNDENYLGRAG